MKILICGLCPLPFENVRKSYGPGVRTWQLARPLAEQGHEVEIVARRIPFTYPPETDDVLEFEADGIAVTTVEWARAEELDVHRSRLHALDPDAVVGATIYGSYDACRLGTDLPIWVDQFGHVMAEAQAKASIADDNRHLAPFWEKERTVLLRGDVFSSVSNPQRFATIGELGAVGRLTKETTGYEFVWTIPCGLDPAPIRRRRTAFRGERVPEDAFVVLWSGSYNVWVDADTLFAGLELAMQRDPRIHFVSTGGAVDGHDESTYRRFRTLVDGSKHRDRYVLLGWIPKEEVYSCYFEADIGINIDRYMYEGLLGSKNRILDWMRAGLPALAAEHAELTTLLGKEGIGFTFDLGEPESLAAELLELAANPRRVNAAGRRAKEYGEQNLTFEATTQPLLEWARSPRRAPDHGRTHMPDFLRDLDAAQATTPLSAGARLRSRVRSSLDRVGVFRLRNRLRHALLR